MKQRFFALCIFTFVGVGAFGQEFMLFSGLQNNLNYNFSNRNNYDSKSSMSAFVGLQYKYQNASNGHILLFGLNYQQYGSHEKIINGGLGSALIDSTKFNKSVLKFDIQPFGIHYENRAFANIGMGFEYLVRESFKTYRHSWAMGGSSSSTIPFTNENSSYSRKIVPIVSGTAGVKILTNEHLNAVIQYQFSLSITPELKYGNTFKSYWMLGLSIPLKEK